MQQLYNSLFYSKRVNDLFADKSFLQYMLRFAVSKCLEVTKGLEVNKEKMLQNLEKTKGLIYAENIALALTGEIGKAAAHQLVEQCCEEARQKNIHKKEAISDHPLVSQL